MFNFFKKKQETKKPVKKEVKGSPFNIESYKADLQALYDCSVQRTAKDFAIQQVAVDGGVINVAMDGLTAMTLKLFNRFITRILWAKRLFLHTLRQTVL